MIVGGLQISLLFLKHCFLQDCGVQSGLFELESKIHCRYLRGFWSYFGSAGEH